MYKSYPRLDNVLVKAPYVPIVCKYCGSHNVIRYGTYNGQQRFWCKDCKRKFAETGEELAMEGLKNLREIEESLA